MRILFISLLFISFLIIGCNGGDSNIEDPPFPPAPNGFCGSSTKGSCVNDSDCVTGGCSGQACQSSEEEPIVTTCEYKECYDDEAYGVGCLCVNNACQWNF